MSWLYQGRVFTEEDIGDNYGFVYILENNLTNRKYIGKKFFTKAGSKTVKGKRKKVRARGGKTRSSLQTHHPSSLQNKI